MEPAQESGELVRQCLRGDRQAMERFYTQHAPAVMVFFLRSGFVQAQAEDLTQDVFLQANRSLKTFDPSRGGLRNWLYAIARNVARRQWSRRRGTAEQDIDLAEEALADQVAPADALAAAEEIRAVGKCVADLPAELANLVRLRYVDALTTRGIAQAAKMPEATVRSRLAEAVKALEKCLKSKGFVKS